MDILLGRQGFGARSYFNTKNDFPIIMFQSIIIRPGRKEAKRLRPKRPSAWRSMPCGWQSLRQRINRHSIPRWCWWFLYRQPNQDVIGENCVRNAAGELNDKDKMKAWAEHCARVLNVEFEWPSNESSDVPTPNTHTTHTRTHERTHTHTHTHTHTYTCWPPPSVFATQIRKALSKVKRNKAVGPSGIIAEMLKPADE